MWLPFAGVRRQRFRQSFPSTFRCFLVDRVELERNIDAGRVLAEDLRALRELAQGRLAARPAVG